MAGEEAMGVGAGETDRMGAWSEVVSKSCNADTDSALERTSTVKEIREVIMDVSQERVGEEVLEVVHISGVQRRIVEYVVDFPVRQGRARNQRLGPHHSQESITEGIGERIVDVQMSKNDQECVEVVDLSHRNARNNGSTSNLWRCQSLISGKLRTLLQHFRFWFVRFRMRFRSRRPAGIIF